MTPVITGLIRPKPFGFVCPTPTIKVKRDLKPVPHLPLKLGRSLMATGLAFVYTLLKSYQLFLKTPFSGYFTIYEWPLK